MSRDRKKFNKAAYVAAAAFSGLFTIGAHAATSLWLDVNGSSSGLGTAANNSTFNWDNAVWASSSSPGTAAPGHWANGDFARFSTGASGTSYTVTMSGDEQNVGWFETVNGVNLTLNATGSGTLDVTGGIQGILNGGSGSSMKINAPISGAGGIAPSNGGSVFLHGTNTFTGGTSLSSSSTLLFFNNNSAFGTGDITNNLNSSTGFVPLLAEAPLTLTNNWIQGTTTVGSGLNFAANANCPLTLAGSVSLTGGTMNLRNNGDATSPLTVSGSIKGSNGLILSANNGGTIIFSGANSYTGTTNISKGLSSLILKLAGTNEIASSSLITLSGGTLNPDGFNQNMNSAPLLLTANSTIDYGVGASEVDFANSASQAWTASTVLNLANWDPTADKLRFDAGPTGLTSSQLAMIEFNGNAATLGTAQLDSNGYVYVPEPSSLALIGLGAVSTMRKRRSKEV